MKNYFGKQQLGNWLATGIAFIVIIVLSVICAKWDTSEPVPAEFKRWSEDK